MIGNLTGWHFLIIAGVLSAVILIALALVFSIVRLARRRPAVSGGTADPATRLAQLDQLRAKGLVTEAEYDAKRREILGLL